METPQPLNKTVFIFANGDANDGPLVRQALSTYPDATVIAADGGARQAIYYGKVIDEVIGDMDSLDDDEIAALEAAGATLLRHPVEKDETDLELALLRAAKMGANKIRLFAALGDRLDQTLSISRYDCRFRPRRGYALPDPSERGSGRYSHREPLLSSKE